MNLRILGRIFNPNPISLDESRLCWSWRIAHRKDLESAQEHIDIPYQIAFLDYCDDFICQTMQKVFYVVRLRIPYIESLVFGRRKSFQSDRTGGNLSPIFGLEE